MEEFCKRRGYNVVKGTLKWWGRYARKVIGIEDERKVFHSFRLKMLAETAEFNRNMMPLLAMQAVTLGVRMVLALSRFAEETGRLRYESLNRING